VNDTRNDPVPRRTFGTTALRLSTVGIGSWAMGGPWERGWGAQDDDESAAAIRHAVERGVNWIDTAAVYGHGHAEEVVGRTIADFPVADRPHVFTKCGRRRTPEGVRSIGDPASIVAEVDASLRRLGVDRVDLVQLHWPPTDGTPLADTWAALAGLREQGKIAYLGAGNLSAAQLAAVHAVAPIDAFQPPLSLVNRSAEAALAWCADHRTGTVVYSPLQSGLLTGGYDRDRIAAMDDGDWRKTDAEFTEPRLSANLELVDLLRDVADELGCTVSELAVAWTLHRPGVTAAIVGARRPAQVDGWVGAGSLTLPTEVVVRLTRASDAARSASGVNA
jgi:aryl-alcohol dehydrogenase-like predicted oxidoreductase